MNECFCLKSHLSTATPGWNGSPEERFLGQLEQIFTDRMCFLSPNQWCQSNERRTPNFVYFC